MPEPLRGWSVMARIPWLALADLGGTGFRQVQHDFVSHAPVLWSPPGYEEKFGGPLDRVRCGLLS
jgi:hypothetical protein